MSETKSQTPETDKASFDVDVVGDAYTKREYYQGADFVETDFAKSLEISRDQWKAVAEDLACMVKEDCVSLQKFNQLKESK